MTGPDADLTAVRVRLAQALAAARRRSIEPSNDPIVSGPPGMPPTVRRLIVWAGVVLALLVAYQLMQSPRKKPAHPPKAAAPDAPAGAFAPSAPGVHTYPDWIRRPTAEDLAGHYPFFAQRFGKEGQATIRCRVMVSGGLEGCVVVSESPPGWGFGKASVAMAKGFRMRPATIDGRPVGGAPVTIPLNFTLR